MSTQPALYEQGLTHTRTDPERRGYGFKGRLAGSLYRTGMCAAFGVVLGAVYFLGKI